MVAMIRLETIILAATAVQIIPYLVVILVMLLLLLLPSSNFHLTQKQRMNFAQIFKKWLWHLTYDQVSIYTQRLIKFEIVVLDIFDFFIISNFAFFH